MRWQTFAYAAAVSIGAITNVHALGNHLRVEVAQSDYSDPGKQIAWIEKSKDAIRARLKDPGSATFRNTVFRAVNGNLPLVCGEVNSRNGFGGYTGYEHFIAGGSNAALAYLESEFAQGEFADLWNQICVRGKM